MQAEEIENKRLSQSIEYMKTIDVTENLNDMTWRFCLSPELWAKHKNYVQEVDLSKFKKIKFFSEDGKEISDEINKVPTTYGGIYLYVIENPIIPNTGQYIMYVGEAKKTKEENLRARLRSHYNQYRSLDENERLIRVFDYWKKYVYVLYLSVTGNKKIELVEDELILSLTPPCNKDYPSPAIRKKLSMFQYS